MSANRVTGLASAIDPPSTQTSAVSSLASRLERASLTSSSNTSPSDTSMEPTRRVSDLAGRFSAVDARPPAPSHTHHIKPTAPIPRANPKPDTNNRDLPSQQAPSQQAPSQHAPNVAHLSRAFSATSSSAPPSAVAAATAAFQAAENANDTAPETKVSAFARRLDSGLGAAQLETPDPTTRVAEAARSLQSKHTVPTDKVLHKFAGAREQARVQADADRSAAAHEGGASFARVASRFEEGIATDTHDTSLPDSRPNIEVASVASKFEAGTAGVKHQEEPDGAAAKGRFRDAARMFGGS